VPALPAQFVNRAQLLAQAKQALLQPGTGQAVRMVGLVGMGGTGKSILANALAHDADVVQAFPDGIVRLEVGQHPELLAQQARLITWP
jgi:predicted ATPase